MSGYNETTAAILNILQNGQATIDEIAEELGCSRSNVATAILKLLRQQRVERERVAMNAPVVIRKAEGRRKAVTRPRHVYVYSINGRGEDRLKSIRRALE